MADLYDAGQVIDKTLVALKDLPVYDTYPRTGVTPKQIGTITSGNPAGTVYSYIDADTTQGRQALWWMFYPVSDFNSNYYYMPHAQGDFDVSALNQQGVISVADQVKQQQEANKPWYTQIVDQIIPVALIAILGGAVIRGVLSKKG